MTTAHLVSTTSRRAIPLLPLSIGWREGWGERPRPTLLPAALPPLPTRCDGAAARRVGWGEGRGEGPDFLRPLVLTRFARMTAARGVLLDDGTMIALTTREPGNSNSPAFRRAWPRAGQS